MDWLSPQVWLGGCASWILVVANDLCELTQCRSQATAADSHQLLFCIIYLVCMYYLIIVWFFKFVLVPHVVFCSQVWFYRVNQGTLSSIVYDFPYQCIHLELVGVPLGSLRQWLRLRVALHDCIRFLLIHLILSGKVVLQLNVFSPITWFVIYLLLVAYICCLALVMNFWSKSQNTGSVFTAGKFYSPTYWVYTGIFNVSRWRDLVELKVLIFSLFVGKEN